MLHAAPVRCTLSGVDRELSLSETHPFSPSILQKEWALLCACVSPEVNNIDIQGLLVPGLDWSNLINLAEEHSVQGIVAQRLEQLGFPSIPLTVREKLQSRMRTQHLFTLSMTAELFRILHEFSQAKVNTVLVKGPLLSLLAYGDPAVRSYVDLDLLVRHSEIQSATRLMLDMGFHSDIPLSAIRAEKIPGEYLFRRPGTKHIVELHTEHTFRYYPNPMRIGDLFERRRSISLEGRDIPALSLEDEFVLVSIHGAKHLWEQLLWVSDVAGLITRHPEMDWERALQAAAVAGAQRMLRVAVHLASLVTHIKPPVALEEEMRKDSACDELCRQILAWLPYAGALPPPLLRRAIFRLKIAGGGVPGARYLARLTFSPTQEDWVKGQEAQHPRIREALRRPLRLFRRYGPNQ